MIDTVRLNGKYAVVTANADFHPIRNLHKIVPELEQLDFKGTVVFDLLAVNGLSENRFISINFDGRTFNRRSYSIAPSSSLGDLESVQNKMLMHELAFMTSTVLTATEIQSFRRQ